MKGIDIQKTFLSTIVLPAANIFCILLVLNILSDDLWILDLGFLHLLAIFLLLGVTIMNIPFIQTIRTLTQKNLARASFLLGSIVLISAFLFLLFTATQVLWLASVPLLLTGITIIKRAFQQTRQELPVLTVASFGSALFFLLTQTIPFLWFGFQQTSLFISHAVGLLTGTPLLLGPSTSGLWIISTILIFLSSSYILGTRHTRKGAIRFIGSMSIIVLIWLIYLGSLSVLSFSTKTDTVYFHPILLIFCLIPAFFYFLRTDYKEQVPTFISLRRSAKKLLSNGSLWAVLFIFLSATLLTTTLQLDNHSSEKQKIVFYGQHMLGTWDVPAYGKYGRDAVGMFGLLPVYLNASGYLTEIIVDNTTAFLNATQPIEKNITRSLNFTDYVTVIQSDHITGELLHDATIFVVINLNTSFSPDEKIVIWEFVQHGGSLLVLGDHTNVGGIQTSLNDLLTPMGISYRFDAALPLDDKDKWLTCYELPSNEMTLLTNRDQLQISVGASLNITATSFPIIIGKYALSDVGNHSAADMAYLGDYTYNKGEQLGDLVLAAGSYYGNGRTLVFGDTSTFQNAALPLSQPFIQKIMSWLTNNPTQITKTIQLGVSLLLLLGALLAIVFMKHPPIFFTILPVTLCVALLLTTVMNPLLISEKMLTGNLAVIDTSHTERFSLDPFTDNSVSGLTVNLQRNNYLPIFLREFSPPQIFASKLALFIAPTQPFASDEVNILKQYMNQGGFVILATGYEDKGASLPLIKELDLDISQAPLGPVPYVEGNTTEYQNEPRFVDSWPIQYAPSKGVSYYNFTWGDTTYDLVVLVRQGHGGLVLVSDSQFLLDKNLESIYDYWPGNILFIKYLLNELTNLETTP